MAKKKDRTLKIKYFRSGVGRPRTHRAILKGLGLRKLNQVVERPDSPQIRGMVAKIPHLVQIIEGEGS